jgi:hypothetical protein
MTLSYLMVVWMLRRCRPMPLYASWPGQASCLYVNRAEPTQVIAARTVELMAEEAL